MKNAVSNGDEGEELSSGSETVAMISTMRLYRAVYIPERSLQCDSEWMRFLIF